MQAQIWKFQQNTVFADIRTLFFKKNILDLLLV